MLLSCYLNEQDWGLDLTSSSLRYDEKQLELKAISDLAIRMDGWMPRSPSRCQGVTDLAIRRPKGVPMRYPRVPMLLAARTRSTLPVF